MRIESDTLIATAADSRNDVISTSAVVVATILCKVTGLNIIDGIAGIGVAVFILYSGIGLIKETLSPLLGKVPAAEFVNHITEKIQSYPGVIGVHDLMIHDYGPGKSVCHGACGFRQKHLSLRHMRSWMRSSVIFRNRSI